MKAYKMPDGFDGANQVKFLEDSKRIAILTRGDIFVIQPVEEDETKFKVVLSLSIPKKAIKCFDLHIESNSLLLTLEEG